MVTHTGISVFWTYDPLTGRFLIEAEGDGVSLSLKTSNLGYASKLTALVLQSTPAAFAPKPEAPELLPEIAALAERSEDSDMGLLAGQA